jgi:hypothetical protein
MFVKYYALIKISIDYKVVILSGGSKSYCHHILTLVISVLYKSVRFEVLTAVVMKSSLFWDIKP